MDKVSKDPRHQNRQRTIQSLFSWDFNQQDRASLNPTAKKVFGKKTKIDKIIGQCASKWPLEKINKIDLAILRLAIYELYFRQEVPPKVVIDEAVELAKEFGSENSPGFVNGVLGAVYELVNPEEKNEK